MKSFDERLLNAVDRFADKMGPLSYFLASIMQRILPQMTAWAGGGGCGTLCDEARCGSGRRRYMIVTVHSPCDTVYFLDCGC